MVRAETALPAPRALASLLAIALVSSPLSALAAGNQFEEAIEQGPLAAAGVALLGGLLVSLTPCVYPMVAITVSVFGANQSRSRLESFGLSLAFVLGIVAMFAPLGVIAGLTGSLFGAALQNEWLLVGIAALFLAMSASMFGAFEVALPAALVNRLARVGGFGRKGAFGLGLVCGLIAAPCTGPVLTGILTWIAQTKDPAGGALAMIAFSLGLGAPFFLVGTFAVHLPKSGRWMLSVKSLLAIVLAVVALYYLGTAFPELVSWVRPSPALYGALAGTILLGVLFGAIHRDFGSPRLRDKLLKGGGAFITTAAAFTLVTALAAPERSLAWLHVPFAQARERAKAEGRPLLVDFTAAWCNACKELDVVTFAHQSVSSEAGRFVAVKVDATDDEDPIVQETMTSLRVVGLPTVVVFDSNGREVERFTDFVQPSTLLGALRRAN